MTPAEAEARQKATRFTSEKASTAAKARHAVNTKTDSPQKRDVKAMNARSTAGQVAALIRDDPEALLAYREAMLGKEGGDKRSSVTTTDDNVIGERSPVGNSRAYSLARVQRECDADTPKENPLCAHCYMPIGI